MEDNFPQAVPARHEVLFPFPPFREDARRVEPGNDARNAYECAKWGFLMTE